MKKLFYPLALALCLQPSLWAQDTFYVSGMNGSDENPGTEESPWYSLNAEKWTEGCTVVVLDEVYLDPVIGIGEGQEEVKVKEVTIKGGAPEAAIIGLNDEEFESGELNTSSFFDVKRGKLTLQNITLKNLRREEGNTAGGMIFVDAYSELHTENVIFKNSVSEQGINLRGGAICCEGKIYAKNTTFDGCKAFQGGAICLRETEQPIVGHFENCVFSNNESADGAADKGAGAGGGAFYIDGYEMDIKFDKCYFESNKALNTARNATGGAVWLRSNGTADIPCATNVSFTHCTVANSYSLGASGFLHWARPDQGEINLKFINNVLYKNRTAGPQANLITGQKSAPTPGVSGSFVFVNNTSILNNTYVDCVEQVDQNAVNMSDFGGDFDMILVNNIMLETVRIDGGEKPVTYSWGWSVREKDARCTGEYIIKNNVYDGVGGSYDATWGEGFLWNFLDEATATANRNKSVRDKTLEQKYLQLGIGGDLTVPAEGVPYIAISDGEGYAVDGGVESLIYDGEELIPQTDIRGVAKTGYSRDLGAFEFNGEASSISLEKVLSQVRVYPNPVADVLYFTEEVASAEIYTTFGACVSAVSNVKSVNVQNLAKGIYVVKIETKDGIIYSEKIQK